jgi:hypothetical protein
MSADVGSSDAEAAQNARLHALCSRLMRFMRAGALEQEAAIERASGLADTSRPLTKKRWRRALGTAASCQSRHLAPQQNRPLLDHLVGAGEQRRYRAAFLNHALATS